MANREDTTVMSVQLVADTQDFNNKLKGVVNTAKGAGKDISASLAFDNTASLKKVTQVGQAIKTLRDDLSKLRDRTIKVNVDTNINKTMIDNLRAFKSVAKDFPASFSRTFKVKMDIDVKQLKELHQYLPTLRALGRLGNKTIKISTQVDKRSAEEAVRTAENVQKVIDKRKRLPASSSPTTTYNLPQESNSTLLQKAIANDDSFYKKLTETAKARNDNFVAGVEMRSQMRQDRLRQITDAEIAADRRETTRRAAQNLVNAKIDLKSNQTRTDQIIRVFNDNIKKFKEVESRANKSLITANNRVNESTLNPDNFSVFKRITDNYKRNRDRLREYSFEPNPDSLAGRFVSGYRAAEEEKRVKQEEGRTRREEIANRFRQRVSGIAGKTTSVFDNSKIISSLKDLSENFEQAGKKGEGMFSRFFKASFFADILANSVFNVVGAMREGLVQTVLYAARTQELEVVLESLAKVNDISNQTILQQEVGIKRLNITTQDTRETIARFINVGFDLNKASPLARVAQDLAVIGGKSTSEELNQLTIAIQTLQSRNLRSAGVFLTVDEILDKLATTTGRARDSFSTLEKQQAVLNAVLEYGSKVAGTYDAAMGTASKQMRSLERHFREAQNAIGEAFVPALGDGVKLVETLLISVAKYPDAFLGMATSIGIATTALIAFKTQAVSGLATNAISAVAGTKDLATLIARPFGGKGETSREKQRNFEMNRLRDILNEKEMLHEASEKKISQIEQIHAEKRSEFEKVNRDYLHSKNQIQSKQKELDLLSKETKLTEGQTTRKKELVGFIAAETSRREELRAVLRETRKEVDSQKDDPRLANLRATSSRREREVLEADRRLQQRERQNRVDDFGRAVGNIALIGGVIATIVTAGGAIQEIAHALESLKPVDLSLNEKLSNDLFNNMVNQSKLQDIINGKLTNATEIRSAEERVTREMSVESLIAIRARERENGQLLTGLELNKARLEILKEENEQIRQRQNEQRELAGAEVKSAFNNLKTLQERLKVVANAKRISDEFVKREGITKKDSGKFGQTFESITDSVISNPLKRFVGYTDEDIAASLVGNQGHNTYFRGSAYRANKTISDQYITTGKATLKADEDLRKSIEDTLKVMEFQDLRVQDSKELARSIGIYDMQDGFDELVGKIDKVRQELLRIANEKYEITLGITPIEKIGDNILADFTKLVEGRVNKGVADLTEKYLRENAKNIPLSLSTNTPSLLNSGQGGTRLGLKELPVLTPEQQTQVNEVRTRLRYETQATELAGEGGEQLRSRLIAGAAGDLLKQLREGANFQDLMTDESLRKILLGNTQTVKVKDGRAGETDFTFDGNYFKDAQKTAIQNKAITDRLGVIYEDFFGGREIRYAEAVAKAKVDLQDAINPNRQLDLINKQIELTNAQNKLSDMRNNNQEIDRYEQLLKVTNAQIALETAREKQRDAENPELQRLATQTKVVELETQLYELRRGTDPTVERLERQLKIEQGIKDFKDRQKDIESEIAILKTTSTLPAVNAELLAQKSVLNTVQERRQAEQQLTADIAVEIDKRKRYNLNSAAEIDRIVGEVFLERQRSEREGQESLLKSIVNLEYSRGNTEIFANNPAVKEAIKQSEELEKINREGGVQTLILNRTNEILEQKVASNIDISNKLTQSSNEKLDSIGATLAQGFTNMNSAFAVSGTGASIVGGRINPNATFEEVLASVRSSIGTQESGNNYQVRPNARTSATGMFQVMPSNIPSWTQAHYGQRLNQAQFQANPQAQEAVFRGQFGSYLKEGAAKFKGNWDMAVAYASVKWYGKGNARTYEEAINNFARFRNNEPSTGEYARSVLNRIYKSKGLTTTNVPTSVATTEYVKNQAKTLEVLKKDADIATNTEKDKALKVLNDYRKKIDDAERRSREILEERLAQITGSNKALEKFTLIETQAAQEIVSILENNEQLKANQIQKYREINAKDINIIERQNELDKYANERSEERFFGRNRRETQTEVMFGKTADLINRSGEFYDKLIGEEDLARVQRFSDSITETIKLEAEANDRRNQTSLYRSVLEQNFYNEQEKNRQDLEDREVQFELRRMNRMDRTSQYAINLIREEILARNEARETLEIEIEAQMRYNETFLGGTTHIADLQREALRDRLKAYSETVTEILKLENNLVDSQEGMLERLRLKQAQVNNDRKTELETSLSNQIDLEARIARQNDPFDRTGIAQQREKLLEVLAETKTSQEAVGDFFADSFRGIQDGFGGLIDRMTEKLGIFGQAYGNFIKSTVNRLLGSVFQDLTDQLFPRDSALGDAAGLVLGQNTKPEDSIKTEVNARTRSTQALEVFSNALIGAASVVNSVFTGAGGVADNAQFFGGTLLGAGSGLGGIVNFVSGSLKPSSQRGTNFAPRFTNSALTRMADGRDAPQTFSGVATNILDLPSSTRLGASPTPNVSYGNGRSMGGSILAGNQGGIAGILARNPKLSNIANSALLAAPALGASLGGMLGGTSTTGGILGQAGGLLGGIAGVGLTSALTGGALGGSLFGAGSALGGLFGAGGALSVGGLSAAMSATVVLAPIAGAFLIGSYLFGRAKRRREEKKKVNELSGDAIKQLQDLLKSVRSDKTDGQSAITQADEIRKQFMEQTAQLKTKPGKALAKQQLAQMDSLIGQIKSAAGQQKTRQETNLAIVPTYAQGGVADSQLVRVSRGEKLIYPTKTGSSSYKIGGSFDARDNILMRVPVGTVIQNPIQQHYASIRGYASGSTGVGVTNHKVAPVVVHAPPVTVINVMSDEEAQKLAAKIPNAQIHSKVRAHERHDGTLTQDIVDNLRGGTY